VLGVDQRADDLGQVGVPRAERVGGPQRGDGGEVGVAAQRVGQRMHAARGGLLLTVDVGGEPQGAGFEPVEQPAAQRPLLLLVPGFGLPAALALRALDQREVAPALDQLDALLDDAAVGVGPVPGRLGDRGGTVPDEPLRLDGAFGHPPREHDLERPLTQLELRRVGQIVEHHLGCLGVVEQPEAVVDVPVQLLLLRDHPSLQPHPLRSRLGHGFG